MDIVIIVSLHTNSLPGPSSRRKSRGNEKSRNKATDVVTLDSGDSDDLITLDWKLEGYK